MTNPHQQRITAALSKLRAAATASLPDVLMIGGAVAVSHGAWLVTAPAGFIVGGLFSLAGGMLVARRA